MCQVREYIYPLLQEQYSYQNYIWNSHDIKMVFEEMWLDMKFRSQNIKEIVFWGPYSGMPFRVNRKGQSSNRNCL